MQIKIAILTETVANDSIFEFRYSWNSHTHTTKYTTHLIDLERIISEE